jgi:hypothetical protein
VEVDGTPLLVLGNLREGDPGMVPERPLREAGAFGDLPAEIDRKAPPQGPGMRIPQNGRFIVVRVRVEGRTQDGVALVVPEAAAAGPDGPGGAVGAVVDRAEAGGGEGGEDARVR